MKDFALYTLARFGIFIGMFVVVAAIFWLANGREGVWVVWPLVVSAIGSTIVSTYVLRGLRDKVAAGVQARAERMSSRFEEIRGREDAEDDARRAE